MKDSRESLAKINEAEVETRRVRTMVINPYEFMFLFGEGLVFKKRTTLIEGVPEDAKLIGLTYDTRRDRILMVVESKSYEPCKITDVPPMQPILIDLGVVNATRKKKVPRKK